MTWFPKQPTERQDLRHRVPFSDYEEITWRVMCGETLQQVGDDYEVTRERIRQIVKRFGIFPGELQYARMQMRVRKHVEEIIYHMESWHPVRWGNYGLLRPVFERHLKLDDYPDYAELWFRYVVAQSNPYSIRCCPDGRVCARCKVWSPWDNFYADKNLTNGKAQTCIPCARFAVESYHDARFIPKPTVTHRRCPKCKTKKLASAYWRNTHNNSGLQTYCKECHRAWQAGYK